MASGASGIVTRNSKAKTFTAKPVKKGVVKGKPEESAPTDRHEEAAGGMGDAEECTGTTSATLGKEQTEARPGQGRGANKVNKSKEQLPGVFLANRYATSDTEDAMIRNMRGESQEEVLHTDIMAAVEAESDTILKDFGTEELTKIVLITIKAAVPAIVKAVQKQLLSTVDSNRINKNMLESRYKEDELEQYSRKENIRINGIEEEPNDQEESEDQLVEKVCKLAAAAGSNIKESDISTAHRLGGRKKREKTRPVIVRFVSRRKKSDLMKNKSVLRSKDHFKNIFICDDLTSMRYKLFKAAKEKCPYTFTREGKVICKYEGRYVTINNPDDLFLIGFDDLDYTAFGIEL